MPHAGSSSARFKSLLSGLRMSMQIFSLSSLGRGQFNDENRSSAFPVAATDFAAMFLHDSVAHAQPQTNALSHRASSVERIENLAGIFHARAGIGKLNVDRISECMSRDRQHSAVPFFHCVGSVVDDVREN